MRRTVLLVLSIVCGAAAGRELAPLDAGPHAVGFRVVQQYDHARTYRDKTDSVTGLPANGERARPIQTLVWYPAQRGGAPLRYGDYMRTEATDERFDRTPAQIQAAMANLTRGAVRALGEPGAGLAINQRMLAARDALPAAGKYPVVIYSAGGGSTAHESAELGEYLASHGYLFIASRNMGTRSRSMNYDAEGAESQARDIQFLVSYAQTLPQADMAHVAAAGWSWGGMTNVMAAARDNRITALVSFDGTREPELTKRIPRTEVALPWLYVSRRPQTIPELNKAAVETSFSLLNELIYADIYQLIVPSMEHGDFVPGVLRFQPASYFDEYSRDEVETSYRWTARYVLEFLNAHLKGDAAGKAFLANRPAKNGVPAHAMRMQHTPPSGPPANRGAFAAELAKRGYGNALAAYKEMQAREPKFTLSDRDVNTWAYALMGNGTLPAAVDMFKFGLQLYPDNANLHDSLGEAYEASNQPALAAQSYRRSLELDPKNKNAAARIEALQAAVAGGTR